MKKLLIRLALWILDKWSIETVLVKPGSMFYVKGYLYEISKVTQTFALIGSNTVTIEAEERIPMEVRVE